MDIFSILLGIFEFIKLLVIIAIPCFVLYKIFSPLREKLAEKLSLSWFKSSLLLNFILLFAVLLIVFFGFMIYGSVSAVQTISELQDNFMESAFLVISGVFRIAVTAVILSICLLFFELLASMFMEIIDSKYLVSSKVKRTKSKSTSPKSTLLSQALGVILTCIVFLFLFLFVFNWVPLGLFVFIFYGGIAETPLLAIIL